MRRTSVVVVDDSVTIRAMIENLLARDSWISVDGIAANAAAAYALIETLDPDVVTLDINMPGIDGLAMLDHIMMTHPRPVIMLSSLLLDGDPIIEEALSRGAVACFNKSKIVQQAGELMKLIHQAGCVETPILPAAVIAARADHPVRLAA